MLIQTLIGFAVAAIVLMIAISGLYLLWRGIIGDLADDRPRCRTCRYDLSGQYPASMMCPECGSALQAAGAVVAGRRRWRPGLLVAGLLLLTASAIPTALAFQERRTSLPVGAAGQLPGGNIPRDPAADVRPEQRIRERIEELMARRTAEQRVEFRVSEATRMAREKLRVSDRENDNRFGAGLRGAHLDDEYYGDTPEVNQLLNQARELDVIDELMAGQLPFHDFGENTRLLFPGLPEGPSTAFLVDDEDQPRVRSQHEHILGMPSIDELLATDEIEALLMASTLGSLYQPPEGDPLMPRRSDRERRSHGAGDPFLSGSFWAADPLRGGQTDTNWLDGWLGGGFGHGFGADWTAPMTGMQFGFSDPLRRATPPNHPRSSRLNAAPWTDDAQWNPDPLGEDRAFDPDSW